jgi:hypothetical protein
MVNMGDNMTITSKLIASTALISCATVGAGFAVFRFAPSIPFERVTSIALAGTALVAALAGFVFGRLTERDLGAGPAELRHMTSELESGYLNARHAVDAKGGAAADLARTIDKLSEVFRATKAATRSTILAGHKIREATYDRYLGETAREAHAKEIALYADELLIQAEALGKAIDYYSFAPEAESKGRSELTFQAQAPKADAKDAPAMVFESVGNANAIHEEVAKPVLRLLPRVKPRPGRPASLAATSAPAFKLRLLPKPRKEE